MNFIRQCRVFKAVWLIAIHGASLVASNGANPDSARSNPRLCLNAPKLSGPEFPGTPLRIESANSEGVRLLFHAEAGNLYSVEYRDLLANAGEWQVLTNVAAKFVSADPIVFDPDDPAVSRAGGRFYRLVWLGQID